jgi:hypothetical protein
MERTDPSTERARSVSVSIESTHPGRDPDPGTPTPEQGSERSVVVGIDGSNESAAALGWAVE